MLILIARGALVLDLKGNEEEILNYWKEHRINDAVREKGRDGKKFYFLDGPPYAYSDLASHHIWVVTIKDLVLRYKRYRKMNVHDRAGFDVHGLPTENRVERDLGIKSKEDIEKKIGIEKFVEACRALIDTGVSRSIQTFTRFGISLDFEHVYLPLKNEYMSKDWTIFKAIYDKGLIYKGLQPLAYCPHCETVLSAQGPELEYGDDTDPSIFVSFKVAKGKKVEFDSSTYLVIWTTTPWTLPANMAVAANPKEMYVVAKVEGKSYVLAKERLDSFLGLIGTSAVVTKEFYGSELDGTSYTSPLETLVPKQKDFRKYHKVLMSETFVNVAEGSGLLHVAPGHGAEDAKLGKLSRIPIFSPVDEHARYTEDAGSYKGLKVPDEANPKVLQDLKESGALLWKGEVTHSYPHCWRCATKLIYRATDQWFMNVQKIKKKMIKENSKIAWYPSAGQSWFADALQSSPDWTISRQRYWGTPIPIWVCESCQDIEVMGSIDELVKRAGLSAEPKDIHRPHIDAIAFKCKKCQGTMKRILDVFDVWYDAGVSHTASLSQQEFERLFPADWITESLDQIRGWFSVLLRTSVAAYGKTSFKSVSIGGMIKDEMGAQMHRHLGNAVDAMGILSLSSADGYRLWCSSHPRWQDLKLKKQEIVEADRDIITLYNTAELVRELALTADIDLRSVKKPRASSLSGEDAWIYSRLNSLVDSCTRNLDSFLLDVAVNDIRSFIVEDFSRFYLRLAKKRAMAGSKGARKRLVNLAAYVLLNTLVLASVVTPFSTEKIYQELFSGEKRSIFMRDWPRADRKAMSKELEEEFAVAREAITALLNSREKANIKLRWPIAQGAVDVKDDKTQLMLEKLSGLIEEYANIKKLNVRKVESFGREVRPVFARIGPDFKEKAGAVADALRKEDADKLEGAVTESGHYSLHTEKGLADVKAEHFTIVQKLESENAIAFRYGVASVDREMSKELWEEGMLREFERRVQLARKGNGLKKADKIAIYYEASAPFAEVVKKNHTKIKKDVNASELREHVKEGLVPESFDIEDEKLTVAIEKL